MKRNYLSILNATYSFGDLGWSDGYNDLKDDSDEIAKQLYGVIKNDELKSIIILYSEGYEYGCSMSDNIENVYDEDGNIKDEYNDFISLFDYEDKAKELIIKNERGII